MLENITNKKGLIKKAKIFIFNKINLQYQHLKLIHNFTVIAAILLLFHVLLASSTGETSTRAILMITWFLISIGLYIYHKFIGPIILKKNAFEISAIRNENPDVITIKMKREKPFKYLPGQFAYFKFFKKTPGTEEHPFSLSSSPNEKEISFTAKNLGDFTSKLKDLQINDKVSVSNSFGTFSYKYYPKTKSVYYIAGGIGITPFMSMIKSYNNNSPKTLLLWGVRKDSDFIQLNELQNIQKKNNNFKLITVTSDEKNKNGESGYINLNLLEKYIHIENINNSLFFICGPPVMMDLTVKNLKQLGIKKSAIITEKFSF